MSTLTIAIIVVFILGYALIAMESLTKVNKAAIALLMFVFCWTLYMFDPAPFVQLMHPDFKGAGEQVVSFVNALITEHLGDTATTLFFLMGAIATSPQISFRISRIQSCLKIYKAVAER